MGDCPWFPVFIDLSERHVLVAGAGTIAARRIGTLMPFCRHITVVAPDALPEVADRAAAGCLRLLTRPFEPGDLDGAELVLAATNDAALNADIAAQCRAQGIPVNVASDSALCDFYFPGVAMHGSVVVGVTASGRDHRRAREVTRNLKKALERGEV